MLDLQKVALSQAISARLLFDEGTGTTIHDSYQRIPDYTVLGTTTGIWNNAGRLTYHTNGNGHARIVGDSGVDRLFRQDDIDGIGGFLFFMYINAPVVPAANQRLFHYGGKNPDPVQGGINARINTGGVGEVTFSFSSHAYADTGTDLALTSSAIPIAEEHSIACYLDRTTAGDVTGTWYIDGVADTTQTQTQTAPTISPNSGTLRGLEIGGRPTTPPDSLLTRAQVRGVQFHKYYYDASQKVTDDIAALHADPAAELNLGGYSAFNNYWANWLQNNTSTTETNFIDAQHTFLDEASIATGSLNDRWYAYLGGLGYTGSYQDRWNQYWTAQGI